VTTPLYLIAHSVRGEAAFDVATQMLCPHCNPQWSERVHGCFDCDSLGYWWIIPTSGHRAFPYWNIHLDVWGIAPDMPPDWPDHYKTNPAPTLDIMSLLKAHRKGEPKPHIPRRL